ncbi:hypothetical protein D4R20_03260 [bacterium]|nr:MAG: hypothetical protein D4R20_03260 [bacterium]
MSEGLLGGVLHAFRIPFTGLIIGSVAVIIMSLISTYSEKRGVILRACIITILVKMIISPYAPLTAHLSVFLQGLLGEILLGKKELKFIPIIMLGMLTSLLSSFQKIIFLTLIYGKTLWESIDQFSSFVIKEVFKIKNAGSDIKISNVLIFSYIGIHLLGGFVSGFYAFRLNKKLKGLHSERITDLKNELTVFISERKPEGIKAEKPRRKRFFKFSRIAIFLFLVFLLLLSYFYNGNEYFNSQSLIVMLLRSLVLMLIWFKFISPALLKFFRKKLNNRTGKFSSDIDGIIKILPTLKAIVQFSWKKSSEKKGLKRITLFADYTLAIILNDESTI